MAMFNELIENQWDFFQNTILKSELLQVGIFFLIHLFAWTILLLKKLEIEETNTT